MLPFKAVRLIYQTYIFRHLNDQILLSHNLFSKISYLIVNLAGIMEHTREFSATILSKLVAVDTLTRFITV